MLKKLFLYLLTLIPVAGSNGQILEVEIKSVSPETIQVYKKSLDSLSTLYKKRVFGYQLTTIMTPDGSVRETLILHFTINKEVDDTIVWSRELRPTGPLKQVSENRAKPSPHASLKYGAAPVFYGNSYIGFFVQKTGEFTKLSPSDGQLYTMLTKEIKSILADPIKLDKVLKDIIGAAYYKKTVN